jgi:hypothetical protein
MALVLTGYSLEHRQFDAFWSHQHIGTYCPENLPKQMKLLPGVLTPAFHHDWSPDAMASALRRIESGSRMGGVNELTPNRRF